MDWYLVTLDDPNLLDGESILNRFDLLLKAITFKFVILDCLDGSGKKDGAILSLKEKQGVPSQLKELLKGLKDIQQLDWGISFYLKMIRNNGMTIKVLFIPISLLNRYHS